MADRGVKQQQQAAKNQCPHEEAGSESGLSVSVAALRQTLMSKLNLEQGGLSWPHVKHKTKQNRKQFPDDDVKSEPRMCRTITSKLQSLKNFVFNPKKEQGRPRTQYQLMPKKQCLDGEVESKSKLRRWTIGSKDASRSVKTILLVGETGTGKSTMINVMINYFLGVNRDDPVWFELVDEENGKQSESQTSEVTVYEVLGYDSPNFPHNLCIIDTPGYGDTRGTDHDAQVARLLYDLFRCKDAVRQIDAVGLVLKESTNRLSDRQQYIFNSVISLFGKDMEQNIVALITHSNGISAANALQALEDADIRIAKNKQKEPFYFSFDNCQNEVSKGRRGEERAMQYAWDTSNQGMQDFLSFLDAAKPQKLEMTVEVLEKHIQIEACFNSLQERIKIIELKQVELNHIEEAIKSYREEAQNLPTFAITVDEAYKEKIPLPRGKALFCNFCKENCHYPGCTWAINPSWCEVMNDDFCTSCSGMCHHSKHERGPWKYVTKTRSVTKTVEDLAKKYVISQKTQKSVDMLIAFRKEIDEAVREKDKLVENAYKCVIKLEDISLKKNSVHTYIHLDFLIAKLNERGNDEKVRKLLSIQKRMKDEVKGGLGYALGIK